MKKRLLAALTVGAALALAVPVYGDSVKVDFEPLVLNDGWVETFMAREEVHYFPLMKSLDK